MVATDDPAGSSGCSAASVELRYRGEQRRSQRLRRVGGDPPPEVSMAAST
ncbi:MAG: hypothetical protein ACLVL7_08030 [Anaerotruncus massiliensis (ex Togo et al. 2019)]